MRPLFRHKYIAKDRGNMDCRRFWGLQLEVLFRGYSHKEMFEIEALIADLVANLKQKARKSGELKEIQIEEMRTRAFKDVLL